MMEGVSERPTRESSGARRIIDFFGPGGLLVLLVTVVALLGWWNWDRGRQVPLPPQAHDVTSQVLGSFAKETNYFVPASVADVRTFYQQALTQRGWAYCGSRATAGCTNLENLVEQPQAEQVDVYRRAEDQERTGSTIEILATEIENGESRVSILEANPVR